MSEDDKLCMCVEKEGGENRKQEHAYISRHLIDMEQRPCEILEKIHDYDYSAIEI